MSDGRLAFLEGACKGMREGNDALRLRLAEADAKIAELREALGCEMDDTRNACGVLNDELDRVNKRLAEAEALLREVLDEADFDHDGIRHKIVAFLTPAIAQAAGGGPLPVPDGFGSEGLTAPDQPAVGVNTDENSDWRERELP